MNKKYVDLSKKDDFGLHLGLFIYIALINTVMLLLSEPLESVGYRGWAFFMVNILFFIFPEPDFKARLIKMAVSSLTGLVLAHVMIILYVGPLAGLGVFGLILPLVCCLALIILGGSYLPLCFNAATFAYFTCALVNAEEAVYNIVPCMVFAVLGVVIVDGGAVLIVKKYYRNKAAKKNAKADD